MRSGGDSVSASQQINDSKVSGGTPAVKRDSGRAWDFWALRVFLIGCLAAVCYVLRPFGLHGGLAASVGFASALAVLVAERRLRCLALKGLIGGAFGTLLGMFAALLVTLVVSRTSQGEPTKSFLELLSLLAFGYLGLVLGALRWPEVAARSLASAVELPPPGNTSIKLLDTSVLIDGRIADICEAHFVDGTILVPQFVLHELQLVADSGDALKRQRGRRGLEVLQRIQKMPGINVRILDEEPMQSEDVDHKLVELARRLGAKIVTNDFNLNKVATLQGLAVLNVNQLANALKPAVLPGEPLRVLILREGKEASQGVAYLDDGTMVVVDGARKLLNKSVDVIVTSVHQTTAGKMIFGRLDDRASESGSTPKASASAAGAGRADTSGNS
jgi:uncharacterized protein YacL